MPLLAMADMRAIAVPWKHDLAMVTLGLNTSRLDYCNVPYVGPRLKMVGNLQLIKNAATRLLSEVRNAGFVCMSNRNLQKKQALNSE